MTIPDKNSRESLMNTAKNYHSQLKENEGAMAYWLNRGLTEETVNQFGLGFVGEPDTPEDEPYTGRLVIPYITRSYVHGMSCIGFKFRSLGGDGPKYLYRKGLNPKLFNPVALTRDTEIICVAEGEVDAMTAEQAGIPCVGIPGATHWESWYSRLFTGYRSVILLQDNDPPNKNGQPTGGELMADIWTKHIRGIKVIRMAEDVNADAQAFGEEYLRELVGL